MILIIVMKTGGLKKRNKTGGSARKDASFNVNRSTQLGMNTLLLPSNPLMIFKLAYNPDNTQRDIKLTAKERGFFSSQKIQQKF